MNEPPEQTRKDFLSMVIAHPVQVSEEIRGHGPGVGVPLVEVSFECSFDHPRDFGCYVRTALREGWNGSSLDGPHELRRVGRGKQAFVGDHLPKEHTEGPDVSLVVPIFPEEVLGCHVCKLALDYTLPRFQVTVRGEHHAEIDEFHAPIRGQYDILWRDVAVDRLQGSAAWILGLMDCLQSRSNAEPDTGNCQGLFIRRSQ